MKSKLQQYLSLEDNVSEPTEVVAAVIETDEEVVIEIEIPAAVIVTDDEVEEAEAELDELEAEYLDESQVVVIEEAQEVRAAIEEYRHILQHGLDQKSYSPQTVALVQLALEEYRETFGGTILIPSLEEIHKDNLDVYYTAAMESFGGFLARVIRVIPAALDRATSKLADGLEARKNRKIGEKINKLANAAIGAASGKTTAVSLNMKGREQVFGHAGGLPSNIPQAIKQDQVAIQQFATKNVLPYFTYAEAVLRIVGDGAINGGPGKTGKLAAKVLQLPHPLKGITQDQISGKSFLRNRHVEVETTTVEGTDEIAKLNAAKKNTYLLEKGKRPDAKFATFEFSAGDISGLANLAKAYGVLADKLIVEFGKYAKAGEVTKLFHNAHASTTLTAQSATWNDDKALDYALSVGVYAQNYAIVNVYRVLDHVQTMGIETAKLALKAAKKLK